jgi:hypothetical protein
MLALGISASLGEACWSDSCFCVDESPLLIASCWSSKLLSRELFEECWFLRTPVGFVNDIDGSEPEDIQAGWRPPINARLVTFAAAIRVDSASLLEVGAAFSFKCEVAAMFHLDL